MCHLHYKTLKLCEIPVRKITVLAVINVLVVVVLLACLQSHDEIRLAAQLIVSIKFMASGHLHNDDNAAAAVTAAFDEDNQDEDHR